MAKKKYYVVWNGRKRGVFSNWEECKEQVQEFDNAHYKSFESLDEAEKAFQNTPSRFHPKNLEHPKERSILKRPTEESISVDAACSGNPGKMEYRGVFTQSKEEIFHLKFDLGTNNIGEFLAIVHAAALTQQKGWKYDIYTDSMTALSWISKKYCNTKMEITDSRLKDIVQRAENWLKNNNIEVKIKKWNTAAWGEIPADFGRK